MVGINLIDNARKAINVYCKKMDYKQESEIEIEFTNVGCRLRASVMDESEHEHTIRVFIEDGGLHQFLKDRCEIDVKVNELLKEGK